MLVYRCVMTSMVSVRSAWIEGLHNPTLAPSTFPHHAPPLVSKKIAILNHARCPTPEHAFGLPRTKQTILVSAALSTSSQRTLMRASPDPRDPG